LKNVRIFKGLEKRDFYTAGIQPVYGGYYSFIDKIRPSRTPPRWKTLPHTEISKELLQDEEVSENFIYSTRLRYIARALQDIVGEKSDWVTTAVTIDLSTNRSKRLAKNSQGPATAYGSALRTRLKRGLRSIEPNFIAVLEETKGKLHTHLLIGHPKEGLKAICKLLGQDASTRSNRILTRQSFRRWSLAKKGTAEYALEELDRDYGLGNFPTWGLRGARSGYYRKCPVDSGWLDYLAKALDRSSPHFSSHRHYYCPNHISKRAQRTYDEQRRRLLDTRDM